VEGLADEVYRVQLDPHPLPWTPGDCVTLYGPGTEEGRPYSFSGPPDAAYTEFWIRRFPQGRISSFLTRLEAGSTVEVSPPFGWFRPCEPAGVSRIFIATGTGIAPFLSALSTGPSASVLILWGMRRSLPVPDVLSGYALQRCVSGEGKAGGVPRRVTDLLPELDLGGMPHFYLCGLDVMIEEVSRILRERGVPDQRIHTECFFTSSSSSS
jgi:ferredoxin-NADP reductase